MSSIDTEEQSKYPPERLRGLVPYKSGQSGNPGGIRKGTVIVSEAYKRLGAMPLEQLRAYQPRSAIEQGIKQAVLRAAEAEEWQAAHAALKEIADRTEGKAVQRRVVSARRMWSAKRNWLMPSACACVTTSSPTAVKLPVATNAPSA